MGIVEKIQFGQKIISVTAREIGANIRAVNLYPFGIFYGREQGHPHPAYAENPRPILLVHGVVHNASAFIPLKRYMEKEGWKNIFSLNYPTRHGSLTKMVDILEQRVEEVLAATQSPQLDIVGHSLGGLISRYYMSVGNGRGKVRHLVTLGSPHKGTPLSRMLATPFFGGLRTDLRSNSYFTRQLNETALPRQSRLTSIYAKYDFVAWPGDNCRVEGLPSSSFQNIELESVGHLGLLYSEESFDSVMKSLLSDNTKP